MNLELFTISLLNGLSYGLLLFMLSSGLTLIFSMMGVLNFAHASFYMVGAYLAYSTSKVVGFWWSLLVAPMLVFVLGAAFERFCLRRVRQFGHIPELLITFGLSYLLLELVQLVWGRAAVNPVLPEALQGPLLTVFGTHFPKSRAFVMCISLAMLAGISLLFARTRIGLVIRAAITHPETVESLGHDVPRVFTLVFAGGAALAGLAGVVGGNVFVTEPAMAGSIGSIIFVVVIVGGLGSLPGAFLASVLIGLLQTFAVAMDHSIGALLANFNYVHTPENIAYPLMAITVSQLAPILPFLLLVLVLIFRPKGLLGTRES